MQMVVSHLATGVYACALDRTRAEMAGLAGKPGGQLARGRSGAASGGVCVAVGARLGKLAGQSCAM
jgi:hypothetical protein